MNTVRPRLLLHRRRAFACLALWSVAILVFETSTLQADPTSALQSPTGQLFEDHESFVRTEPGNPEAQLRLLQAYALLDHVGPQTILELMQTVGRIAEEHGSTAALKQRARYLESATLLRMGRVDEARAIVQSLGFVSRFLIAGPFDNEGGAGFLQSTEADDAITKAINPGAPMRGRMGHSVRWRQLPEEAVPYGYVHLETAVYPTSQICTYAAADILSDKAASGQLRIGALGAFIAYWNGQPALEDERYIGQDFDRHAATVQLRPGPNRLVIKVCNKDQQSLGFMARLTDADGRPLAVEFSASKLGPSREAIRQRPKKVQTPFDKLQAAARKRRASTDVRYKAALWMHLTGAEDPDRHDARDLARGACDSLEQAEHCLLWADLSDDRNERLEAIHAATAIEPDSFDARLALSHMELSGFNHTTARPLITALREQAPNDPRAQLAYVELLARDGFSLCALAELEKTIDRIGPLPSLLQVGAFLSEQASRPEKVISFNQQLLISAFTTREVHQVLTRDALARLDKTQFGRHLDALIALAPFEDATWSTAATLYEGAGEPGQALEAHQTRLRLNPQNPDAIEAFGFYLLRQGRSEDGNQQLARALELRPQSVAVRRYFDHINSHETIEQRYAIAPAEFLEPGEAVQINHYGVTYLVDQTITKVHPSGLASRYVQTATLINTEEAARSWRYYYISLVPKAEELRVLNARVFKPDGGVEEILGRGTVPTSEPWYRLYYDVNAEVLELPPLSPGDVVEVSYRLDDVTPLNAFYDYFGDFQLINDDAPKKFWRYVAIVPASRRLAVGPIDVPVRTTVSEEDDNRVYSFQAEDLPAVHREDDMGGTTSGMGYLHLSTYTSWESLGRWYRGLINGQLFPDEPLILKARELTRGMKDTRQKVERIYRYVIESTRYVALEFGIHGYKPYKVSQVLSRGFGDCKDKASLLVAMLKEVGIEAELALVRTRHVGDIHQTPASLAAFNHAIVYVPGLDLWLDGTAEHHGADELPFADQGVLALRVRPKTAVITRTPTMPAKSDTRRVSWKIHLERNGAAAVEGFLEARGPSAAALRQEFEVEQTRRERFGSMLSAELPHAQLTNTVFEQIADPNAAVSIRYTAQVPDLGHNAGGWLSLPSPVELGLTERYVRTPQRKHPLVVGPRRHTVKEITITAPPGYSVGSLPESQSISSSFGWLTLEVQQDKASVKVVRVFELSAPEIAAKDYPAFADFCRKVDAALAGPIRFSRNGAAR